MGVVLNACSPVCRTFREEEHESEASLGYIVSTKLARVTYQGLASKSKPNQPTKTQKLNLSFAYPVPSPFCC